MNPWSASVEALASVILAVGDALAGGPVVGIVVTIFVARMALIPVLLPLAVHTRDRQRVVRRIRPQIKALDRQFRDEPGTLSKELSALHRAHGIAVVDWPGLGGALIQIPVLIALFQAVLLIWEPAAMTVAGLALGAVAGGLSLVGTRLSGQAEGATWMLWLSTLLPVAICVWLGPGIGLYLIGFYAAGAVQGALMVRRSATVEEAEP